MKAEIIAVGSELLTPDHLDTNSLFITEKLNEAGFEVRLKTIVGDDVEDIAALVGEALSRSDLILLCGGLGPTEDDLTRAGVARALNRSIAVDPAVVEVIRRKFARRGYPMPKINERQAEVIEGAETLENPFGTAPGMWIEEHGIAMVLMPGPSKELRPMLENSVIPRVKRMGGGRLLASKSYSVTGMTESEVDSRIAPIYKSYPRVRTIILATPGYIGLRLHRWLEPDEDPADLEEVASKIEEALGEAIFTTRGESLEEVVGRLLRQSQSTLAVAESCTAGMLAARITCIPGSSEYFLGGILCYSNEVKKGLCRVPAETLEKHGAVSAEVAEALARSVREVLGSSVGLSITGIAGPSGGSEEKPVGLVFVGLSDKERLLHVRRILPGGREAIRERSTYLALSCLRKFLLSKIISG